MNIEVTKDLVKINPTYNVHNGEYNANELIFEFSEEYEELTTKAIFKDSKSIIEVPIINNKCYIPNEILSSNSRECELRVYAYECDGEKLKLRYSPSYAIFSISTGSYLANAEGGEEITPSQFEQYTDALNKGLEEQKKAIQELNEEITIVKENEEQRQSNEENRVDNENERIDNETTRKENENIRNSNENQRLLDEEIRANNETTRTTNENERKENEDIRKSNEKTRITNENERMSNENIRKSNENQRLLDEEIRTNNETIRITNEKERQEYTTQLKQDVEDGKFNGKSIEFIWKDTKLGIRLNGDTEYTFVDLKGVQGIKGDTGDPFRIDYRYDSREQMEADFENVEEGKYAMIVGDVEKEDTAKLFYRSATKWDYIADFSGSKGIKGETGPQGIQGIQGETGPVGPAGPQGEKGEPGDIVQQEAIDELNSEISDLVSILPKKTSEGTNSLEYDKAKAFRIPKANYKGNVEQETLSGKNLFNLPDFTKTNNGVTITAKNNFISVKGNLTENWFNIANNFKIKLEPGTYTYRATEQPVFRYNLTLYDNEENKKTIYGNVSSPTTFTIDKEYEFNSLASDKNTIGTELDYSFNFQIEKNSVATDFEPYTGGIPAPNPYYPMEVKTLKGYNLLNFNELEQVQMNKTTAEILGMNEIKVKGNNMIQGGSHFVKYYICDINDEMIEKGITISANIINTTSNKARMLICQMNSSNTNLDRSGLDDSGYTYFKPVKNLEYNRLGLVVYSNAGSSTIENDKDIYYKDVMIKLGDYKPYLPYKLIGVRRIGKNLWPYNNARYTYSGASWCYVDGKGQAYNADVLDRTDKKIELKKGTYTLSVESLTNVDMVQLVKTEGKVLGGQINPTNKSVTFELPSDDMVTVRIRNSLANVETVVTGIMLSEDGVAYEPYTEQINYIDLQDNEVLSDDELELRDGHIWLKKNWSKIVLDGSETWSKSNNRFVSNVVSEKIKTPTSDNEVAKVYSNKAVAISINESVQAQRKDGVAVAASGNLVIYNESLINLTKEEFREYVRENPIEIHYLLVKSEIIDLGKTTIKSLEGLNNVEILATLEPTEMSETYIYDLQKELDEIKEMLINPTGIKMYDSNLGE